MEIIIITRIQTSIIMIAIMMPDTDVQTIVLSHGAHMLPMAIMPKKANMLSHDAMVTGIGMRDMPAVIIEL